MASGDSTLGLLAGRADRISDPSITDVRADRDHQSARGGQRCNTEHAVMAAPMSHTLLALRRVSVTIHDLVILGALPKLRRGGR